jgi:hypothetical protein
MAGAGTTDGVIYSIFEKLQITCVRLQQSLLFLGGLACPSRRMTQLYQPDLIRGIDVRPRRRFIGSVDGGDAAGSSASSSTMSAIR